MEFEVLLSNLTNMTIEQMLSYSNVTVRIIGKIYGNPGKIIGSSFVFNESRE